MFSFFKKKPQQQDLGEAPADFSFLRADMHSHLIPGIDDGAPDMETSKAMILRLKELGFTKLITTPHIMLEFYDNSFEKVTKHFAELKRFIDSQDMGVELGVGAEYYLDSFFLPSVMPDGLLSFGGDKKYVLVEVSMAGWPRQFSDILFSIQAEGYSPILAHPERYQYEEDIKVFQGWKEKGLLFQMNLLSILGYYGRGVKTAAEHYLEHELYDFCGTDMHHLRHGDNLAKLAKEHPELMNRLAHYPHWRNSTL
jgi:tyrosine-protein phosphatase YwqE